MTKDQGAQDPIRLELGATAEPRTCGSCVHLERREPWNGDYGGYCSIILPPQFAKKQWDSESRPVEWMQDTSRCDLYKSTGKAYIVSKLVKL